MNPQVAGQEIPIRVRRGEVTPEMHRRARLPTTGSTLPQSLSNIHSPPLRARTSFGDICGVSATFDLFPRVKRQRGIHLLNSL
jgi:hypothetical protein